MKKIEKDFRNELEKYITIEDKIDFLINSKFQLVMIEHWGAEEVDKNNIIHKLILELSEDNEESNKGLEAIS